MSSLRIIVWEEDGAWLGDLQDYPDYRTQGEMLEDSKEPLKELQGDLTLRDRGDATPH